ncbi:MAG: LptF/LptG family permease [Mediterranea sp.]|jgi:lipopolysaccharide export system permease protein|nr:LptF/LptG family permease [Mediterranea sp.]
MLRIKKLDLFIVKSFLLLFVGTFFICLFIFMMQFLWRYVDDLVGKGLGMDVLAKFFLYSGLTLVPVSLPLAVLLASLITFGNFGERYELLAMKAAGISLLKIMRPLAFLICGVVAVSFYFQNVIGPIAQGKLYTLLRSVKDKSPELEIPEGVFYTEITNYNLRVEKKDRHTGLLHDVLIYDMKDGFENARVIYADSGRLEMTADKKHLWLHLYDGDLFENLRAQSMKSQNVPYRREEFREKHTLIEFDSDFTMASSDYMSNNFLTKNIGELQHSIDSIKIWGDSVGRQYYNDLSDAALRPSYTLVKADSSRIEEADISAYDIDSLYDIASLTQKQKIISSAVSRAENTNTDLKFKGSTIGQNDFVLRRHEIEWHKKFTISLSCLLFFFIGAPLGGIIRKGGLGMPVVVSVVLFIVYYIIDNTGYKMSRDGKWIVWTGMWLSSLVLASLGTFFTYKSNNDSVVLNADAYMLWLKKVMGVRSQRHLFKKEVIIQDPDYGSLPSRLDGLTASCRRYLDENRLTKAPGYFRLWMSDAKDDEMLTIDERLEEAVEELSNTKSAILLASVNNYPIIPVSAHVRPFPGHWLNVAAGVIFPLGLFFYFRIWAFRKRLAKDLERVIQTNEQIKAIIRDGEYINK